MLKKLLPLTVIFLAVTLLYFPVFSTYFSQDDFFHFKVSQTNGSLNEFINLFGFHSFTQRDIAFYRPVSRELLFNIYYPLFNLNSIPFRLFSFLIHFINIFLVYLLVDKLFHRKSLSFFVSFFFGITAANVATLYYLAGGLQTLLATMFSLLSLLFYIKYLETEKTKFQIFSFLLFLGGISSHEQAIITPLLIYGLILIHKPKHIKRKIIYLLPYFVTIAALLYIEIFIIGFSNEQQYKAVFNIKTVLNSLFWYSNWALGIPETLIDFVFPGFRLNPNLLKYWSNYYAFIFPSYFLSILLIGISFLYSLTKIKLWKKREFWFCLIWFPLGLLPVLLLPLHKSTHYLEISLPAFWTIIGYITLNFYQELKRINTILAKAFLVIFILSLITLSSTSAILGSTNYWAATRGRLAEKLISEVKNNYPTLPKGATLYFQNDPSYPHLTKEWGGSSRQASIILNGSDALQLLYKDPTLKIFYEDTIKPLPETPQNKIYTSIIKIY